MQQQNTNYVELVLSMFNQFIFQDCKNNIKEIKYYFQTNPATQGNALIEEFINSIDTYDFSSCDIPLFQSVCIKTRKTQQETDEIVKRIQMYKRLSKDQIEPFRKQVKDIIGELCLRKAYKLYNGSPAEIIEYLKKTNIKLSENDYSLTPQTLGQLDLNSLIASSSTSYIPSKFNFINQTFSPNPGYPIGAIYMIIASPGTGKSLFMMNEALNMAMSGKKVCYLMLGDIQERDAIHRLSAIYSGQPFSEVWKNIIPIYTNLCQAVGDRLFIKSLPAGVLDPGEFVDYFKDSDFDAIFADYDSTFKVDGVESSMYDAFGKLYQKLTELTARGKLIYIASQPKIQYYTEEYIPLSGAGESSKKQHYADMIITMGKVTGNPNHLLTMSIVKNRRGEEGDMVRVIRLNNGRFKVIPEGLYNSIKTIPEFQTKKNWTEGDIDIMIHQYKVQEQRMGGAQQQSSPQQKSYQKPQGPSPFGK